MKKIYKRIAPALVALSVVMTGCNKEFLETNPTNAVSGETVFETTEGAYVALNGIYRRNLASYEGSHGHFGQKSYDLTSDLMGLDMVVHTQGYGWFNAEYQYTAIQNAAPGTRSSYTWEFYYILINNANLIIAQVDDATGTQEDKDNIKGQALALRAHSYFYLINFYSQSYKGNESSPGVPLYTAPTSEGAPRGTVQAVYDQIVADLDEAEALLTGKPKADNSHIDARTAAAMRALVALQMEDYPTARAAAARARAGLTPATSAQLLGGTVFNTIGSAEYIWGIGVLVDQATIFASFYSHMDISSGGYADLGTQKKITKDLYDRIPEGDARKGWFTAIGSGTSNNPDLNQTKLRLRQAGNWAADYVFFRAAEQYLIEAEAAARGADEAHARTVLEELIQTRNPDYSAAGLSGQALVDEILVQRRIELWGEGRSLLDVKRLKQGLNRATGDGNHNGSNLMGGTNFNVPPAALSKPDGDPTFLFRIPQDEINQNKELSAADQNP